MSDVKLYLGDCLELMKDLDDASVDAVIADIPYGTTACAWDVVIPFEPMWEQLRRVCSGAIVLFGTQPFSSLLIASNLKEFKYEWIWKKSRSGSPLTAKYMPLKLHEQILVFGKVKVYNPQMEKGAPYARNLNHVGKQNNHRFGIKGVHSKNDGTRFPISVLDIKQDWRRQAQVHPTQKPVALMEYLVKTYSNKGDTVLDFTMGSGTSAVACVKLNRNFIGMEIHEPYFEIAQQRIQNTRADMGQADKIIAPNVTISPMFAT